MGIRNLHTIAVTHAQVVASDALRRLQDNAAERAYRAISRQSEPALEPTAVAARPKIRVVTSTNKPPAGKRTHASLASGKETPATVNRTARVSTPPTPASDVPSTSRRRGGRPRTSSDFEELSAADWKLIRSITENRRTP